MNQCVVLQREISWREKREIPRVERNFREKHSAWREKQKKKTFFRGEKLQRETLPREKLPY